MASTARELRGILGQCEMYLFYKVSRKIPMRVTGVRSRASFANPRTTLELRFGKEARRVP